jgi:hypothetical protein
MVSSYGHGEAKQRCGMEAGKDGIAPGWLLYGRGSKARYCGRSNGGQRGSL